MASAADEVWGSDVADDVWADEGSAADDVWGSDEGEIRAAPSTWGDTASAAYKMLLGDGWSGISTDTATRIAEGEPLTESEQLAYTPQEEREAYGTVIPAGIVGASLLTGNPVAGVGIRPFLARAAQGVGTGALARGSIARARGEDVQDAVLSPGNIGLDIAMSGIPEVLTGARATGRAIAAHTPETIADPVRRFIAEPARRAASAVTDRVGRGTDRVLRWYAARNNPDYGAEVIDNNSLFTLEDAISGRPPLQSGGTSVDDLLAARAPEPEAGFPRPRAEGGIERLRNMVWQGEIRDLERHPDPLIRSFADMTRRRNNIHDSVTQMLLPRAQRVLSEVEPGPQAAELADILNEGRGVNVTAMGGPADLSGPARELRDLLGEVGEARSGRVYDSVTPARAWDLADQGVDVAAIGDEGPFFAEAQRVTSGFFPRRVPRDEALEGVTGLERILAEHPGLSLRQAQQRLRRTAMGNTVGRTRIGEMTDFSRASHDVIPDYLRDEATHIANAEVFGGRPVRMTVGTGRHARDVLVGERGYQVWEHAMNTGDYQAANRIRDVLEQMYDPMVNHADPLMAGIARGTSNMALSHASITNLGQAPTAIWASGGPQNVARGYAMVEDNPMLRELFQSGPRRLDFAEYMQLGRGADQPIAGGGALLGPFEVLQGVENWLRGPASYAAVPFLQDLATEAKAFRDAGKPYTAAMLKKASEAGLDLDFLADDIAKNGVLSQGTWLEGIQNLVRRWQYSTVAGEIPATLRKPTGAMLALYRTYGNKASQHVIDDILTPMFSQDPSLRQLGWQRAALFATTSLPTNAAVSGVRALAKGRAPTVSAALQATASGPFGTIGDYGFRAVDAMTPDWGERPVEQIGEIPLVGVPLSAGAKVLGVAERPGMAAQGALTLGGLVDPRIPLYGQLPLGIARQVLEE